jgi:hypothetical protein
MARFAGNADSATVVAYDRLHDREPQTCAVRLAGVVGREQLSGFFGSQAAAGIRDLDPDRLCLLGCANDQAATFRHGFNRVQN